MIEVLNNCKKMILAMQKNTTRNKRTGSSKLGIN